MIQAVVFDCFGVLWLHGGRHFLRSITPDDKVGQVRDLVSQVDYGFIEQYEFERQVAELTGVSEQEVRDGVLAGFTRNDELLTWIQATLRPAYKIGLLSNISHGTMSKYFSHEQLTSLFDAVVLSSDIGMIKPHRPAYEAIGQALDVQLPQAMMIDDLQENVDGALASGMQALRFVRNKDLFEAFAERN